MAPRARWISDRTTACTLEGERDVDGTRRGGRDRLHLRDARHAARRGPHASQPARQRARPPLHAIGDRGTTTTCSPLLPFSHLFGLAVTAARPSSPARVSPRWRASIPHARRAARRWRDALFVGVPAMFIAHARRTRAARSSARARRALRLCICGGAPLAVELQDRWVETSPASSSGRATGSPKQSPVCLFNRDDLPNVRGTLGMPFPGVEVTIRDPPSRFTRLPGRRPSARSACVATTSFPAT